ncbi:DMT family transporter [bacterium]|nr:DMT family transporter [bacterium]
MCWALDNNFTQKVSAGDPLRIAALKGLSAGTFNLILAAGLRQVQWPSAPVLAGVALTGTLGYGVSLAAFVAALRHLGTARTGAYFSLAPFVGASLSLLIFHEPLTTRFGAAALFMAAGVYLHLTENHDHEHTHEELEHEHEHIHDEHHQHSHEPGQGAAQPHTHRHRHSSLSHKHPHYPDLHHRHEH